MHPPLGTVITEKYRLDRVVGTGDMSTVYAATNLMTGKQMAIKLVRSVSAKDDEHSLRLLGEAKAAAAIDHPNVVNVFDVGRHEGALFLVMELLHGETLSALMLRGVGDPYRFVRLMMPVLRGVHAAHRSGVVHRDLCPDNIFLCCAPSGEARGAKVLDFGISKPARELARHVEARASSARERTEERTRENTPSGTPLYMAPEQARNAHAIDPRCDIYALGVILYRALSGAYPYAAETEKAPALHMADRPATPLHERCPELAPGLADAVMRAIALDPDARFASVAALGEALEPYADGVVFSPGGAERDSATQLRYLRVQPKLPVPRVFAPPRARHTSRTPRALHTGATSVPPPRETRPVFASLSTAEPLASAPAQPPTTALDLHELFDVAEPSRAELRTTQVPPWPGLTRRGLQRPTSDALEVQAPRRLSRRAVRNASRVAAVLLVIGGLASWLGLPRQAPSDAAPASSPSRAGQPRRSTPLPGVTPALSTPANVIPDGKEAPRRLHVHSRTLAPPGSPRAMEPDTGQQSTRQGAEGSENSAGGAAASDLGLTMHSKSIETPAELRGSEPREATRLEQNPYLRR